MKVLILFLGVSVVALTGCQSRPPKASGWNDLSGVNEVPVNKNLPDLKSKIDNKNVWSN